MRPVNEQETRQIGARIRRARERRGIRKTDLASALGVWERTINRWESGTNLPDTKYLHALCDELGVSVVWLLAGKEPNGDDTPVGAVA